jgi:hypothetical protein
MALTIKLGMSPEKQDWLKRRVAETHARIEDHILEELVAQKTAVNAEYEHQWSQRRVSKLWIPAERAEDEERGGYV